MFTRIDETGVTLADGSHQELDTIIWATGFRQNIEHLAPLRLRGPGGGIRMDPPMVADEPRIYLVGYGPSASTIGANRAGRAAVRSLSRYLDQTKGVQISAGCAKGSRMRERESYQLPLQFAGFELPFASGS